MMTHYVDFPQLQIYDLPISPVAFRIGSFEIMWYGIIIAFAMFLCLQLASLHAEKYGLSKEDVSDYFLVVLPSSIVGARLYYVLFALDEFQGDFLKIFNLRTGGLAFYGGVLGGALALVLCSLYKKKSLAQVLDFFVVYLPLGQAIGRWGNFFNQEAFGGNTTLPWGMYSESTRAFLEQVDKTLFPNVDASLPVHPTFFYEFLGNMLLFALLLYARKNKERKDFTLVALYFLGYGILRFFVEGLRTDPLLLMGSSFRVSQVLSFLMFLFALVYFAFPWVKKLFSKEKEME